MDLKYSGIFETTSCDGEGRLENDKGEVFIGEWKNCLFHGKGKFVSTSKNFMAKGE